MQENLSGMRTGRLTVVELSHIGTGYAGYQTTFWKTKCDCGTLKILMRHNLNTVKSCGCLSKEIKIKRLKTHGLSNSPTWITWYDMRRRCEKPGCKNYDRYGGRGIKVCKRWQYFENFYEDMGIKPVGMFLDRVNNNGNYEPSNCRWSTRKQQQNNLRSNRRFILNNEVMTIAQAASFLGISWHRARTFLKNNCVEVVS